MPNITKTCPECGQRFPQAHHRQLFCTGPCQKAFNNRRTARGHKLVTLAMAWRSARGGTRGNPTLRDAAKDAHGAMCRLLDEYAAEDRAAGRMNPTAMYAQLQRYNMAE